jgi:ankyrin repeat protein
LQISTYTTKKLIRVFISSIPPLNAIKSNSLIHEPTLIQGEKFLRRLLELLKQNEEYTYLEETLKALFGSDLHLMLIRAFINGDYKSANLLLDYTPQLEQGMQAIELNKGPIKPLMVAMIYALRADSQLSVLKAIIKLIKKGTLLNEPISMHSKIYPLEFATQLQQMSLVRLFLAEEADPNQGLQLALHLAAMHGGNLDLVNLLLSYQADPARRNEKGDTALHCAVMSNTAFIQKINRQNLIFKDKLKKQALENIGAQRLAISKKLLTVHPNLIKTVNDNYQNTLSLLLEALKQDKKYCLEEIEPDRQLLLKRLIEKGADIYAQDSQGYSPHAIATPPIRHFIKQSYYRV